MYKNNLANLSDKHSRKDMITKIAKTNDCKIYTPEMIQKYKDCFKRILKITKDKTKTKFILYKKIYKWYENENNLNISMEKIYIKSKLGSYESGGCGIGASLFAGITASGIFSYIDNYIKELDPAFLTIYAASILYFGIKILSKEDRKVEMFNMFLEVLNNLEYDKNEK